MHRPACSPPQLTSKATRARLAAALLAAPAIRVAAASGSQAKDYGVQVEGACDDRVASTTLTGHINGCRQNGLKLVAGTLDCAGHQISGPGDHAELVGVRIDRGCGAEVARNRLRRDRAEHPALVESHGDVFADNVLGKSKESAIIPHDDVVAGGIVTKAGTCFELAGAYDGQASGVHVDRCRPRQEREAGGRMPSNNVVSVIRDR